MDDRTKENWCKIMHALEAAGKTNCHLYSRAVAVVKTGVDPGMAKLFRLGGSSLNHD